MAVKTFREGFPVKSPKSYVVSRNGAPDIGGIMVSAGTIADGLVHFDFESRRGQVLNAGFQVDVETFDAIARTWLNWRERECKVAPVVLPDPETQP